MVDSRLTRGELSWLLAQEARGAAQSLREGVNDLKLRSSVNPPEGDEPAASEPDPISSVGTTGSPVESTLKALDDAIALLGEIDSARPGKGRRGRIDLATLLSELAPNSRMTLTPGAGTDVFGDEADLRRMFHVLLSQAHPINAAAAKLDIRRQEDWIRVEIELGPDSGGFGDIESRWLSRMAMRHGGRLELDSGAISVLLPADAVEQTEVKELRRELEQAQQLGEAYARELGTVLGGGELKVDQSLRDRSDVGTRRFALMISMATGLERQLRSVLDGLKADVALAISALGESAPLSQHLQHRVSSLHDLVALLARLSQCPIKEEPRSLDLVMCLRETLVDSSRLATRQGVVVELASSKPTVLVTRPQVFALLARALLEHAILATPKGGTVSVSLVELPSGVTLRVEDGGTFIPPLARTDLFELRLDPSSLGRPAGIQLVAGQVATTYLGGSLELTEGKSGGTAFECELKALI